MGGSNSGWYRGARPRCEHRAALEIKDLLRPYAISYARWRLRDKHYGAAIHVDERGLTITYQACDDAGGFLQSMGAERVDFARAQLRFGARRFFTCAGCRRRCRILYAGVGRLRCRFCLGLRYRSENLSKTDRCWWRAHKIARRAGSTDTTGGFPETKPPRMRWSTFEQLEADYEYQMDLMVLRSMSTIMKAGQRLKQRT